MLSFGLTLPLMGEPDIALGRTGVWQEVRCPESLEAIYSEVADRVRGQAWESAFWMHMLLIVGWPPPDPVIDDLLARDIETELIGHLPLSEARLWSLAPLVDESLLTLAKRRYVNDGFDEHQFEEVLHAFPSHRWMLSSLPMLIPSKPEKAAILASYIRRMPDPEMLVKRPSEIFRRAWHGTTGAAGE